MALLLFLIASFSESCFFITQLCIRAHNMVNMNNTFERKPFWHPLHHFKLQRRLIATYRGASEVPFPSRMKMHIRYSSLFKSSFQQDVKHFERYDSRNRLLIMWDPNWRHHTSSSTRSVVLLPIENALFSSTNSVLQNSEPSLNLFYHYEMQNMNFSCSPVASPFLPFVHASTTFWNDN